MTTLAEVSIGNGVIGVLVVLVLLLLMIYLIRRV